MLETPGGVDDERDLEALLVGVVFVHVAAVLAEAITMVAEYDEDRILVEPQLLVLLDEVLQKEVQVVDGVEVAVELVVLDEVLMPVARGGEVVVVPGARKVFRHERLLPPLPEPLLAGL